LNKAEITSSDIKGKTLEKTKQLIQGLRNEAGKF
jgi:hypothetical protein